MTNRNSTEMHSLSYFEGYFICSRAINYQYYFISNVLVLVIFYCKWIRIGCVCNHALLHLLQLYMKHWKGQIRGSVVVPGEHFWNRHRTAFSVISGYPYSHMFMAIRTRTTPDFSCPLRTADPAVQVYIRADLWVIWVAKLSTRWPCGRSVLLFRVSWKHFAQRPLAWTSYANRLLSYCDDRSNVTELLSFSLPSQFLF